MPSIHWWPLDFSHRPREEEGLSVIGKALLPPSAPWARQALWFPSVCSSAFAELPNPQLARWISSWAGPPPGFMKSKPAWMAWEDWMLSDDSIPIRRKWWWAVRNLGDCWSLGLAHLPVFPKEQLAENISRVLCGAFGLGVGGRAPQEAVSVSLEVSISQIWTSHSTAWKGLASLSLNRELVFWWWPMSPGNNRRRKLTWSLDPCGGSADLMQCGRGPRDLTHVHLPTLAPL